MQVFMSQIANVYESGCKAHLVVLSLGESLAVDDLHVKFLDHQTGHNYDEPQLGSTLSISNAILAVRGLVISTTRNMSLHC